MIRSLAALAVVAPRPAGPPVSAAIEAATPTSTREYILCGALQAMSLLAYSYVAVVAIEAAYAWVSAASGALATYLRLVLASTAAFLLVCAFPIPPNLLPVALSKHQQTPFLCLP